MTDTLFPRDPILRVVPMPSDINSNGHIFGGWVLSQMDIAGGILAGRIADGPVATVAIETMKFIAPILVRDLVSLYATVARRGRTSVAINIEVMAERAGVNHPIPLTSAIFTFVAIDEQARPRPLPPETD
ncbi:acyl-CoA thioesterase [Sphingobium sufflavum]|uniref:acyl-CoA thioesterase n=1 Tax=Sphingobium sufflavum TaxID=1129547 RepID=UPI001F31F6C7|nr:acyl-CoA thioesterase [Sphingobium sufflavum]MCE7794932.1 acyl-CoA thioesterase [Sphingobium sufflavum]